MNQESIDIFKETIGTPKIRFFSKGSILGVLTYILIGYILYSYILSIPLNVYVEYLSILSFSYNLMILGLMIVASVLSAFLYIAQESNYTIVDSFKMFFKIKNNTVYLKKWHIRYALLSKSLEFIIAFALFENYPVISVFYNISIGVSLFIFIMFFSYFRTIIEKWNDADDFQFKAGYDISKSV